MKRSFIHPGTTPTMSFTGFYRNPRPHSTTFVREPTT